MTIKLYDLCGQDNTRFSPFCWRVKLALTHKDLDWVSEPVRFTEIADVPGEHEKKVPIIQDGDHQIYDSWNIAEYLEASYIDEPSLFNDSKAMVRFVQNWTDNTITPAVFMMLVKDIHDSLQPEDQDYFRQTREERIGKTLEEAQTGREERVTTLQQQLQPLRVSLASQPFLGGEHPNYADYVVLSCFQWARSCSSFKLLQDDDSLAEWLKRCADLYPGLLNDVPAFYSY